MKHGRYDFVVLNQSSSHQTFALLERLADEVGPTLLFTGSRLRAPRTEALTVLDAPHYDNSSYKARLKTWLSYTRAAVRLAGELPGKPVVLVTTNPPFGPFLGYWLKKTRGFPFVIRVLDVYPDAIRQSGLARGIFRPVPPLWEVANRISFEEADRVVTLGERMADRIRRFARSRPVEVIPEWVDTDQIAPIPKDQNWFAREHNLLGRLTVLYSGNLGVTHDVEGLFRAIAELERNPHIQFLFVGGGARREELVRRASAFSNCKVLPNQPEEVLPFSLGSADVAIVLLGDSGRGVSMPSKTYHMMASGAAILGISSGDNDLAQTIHRHSAGLNLEPGNTAGIVAALERFASDPTFLRECRQNARNAAESVYSERVCAGALLEMLREVRREATP